MSFWSNKNSSAPIINAKKPRSGHGLLVNVVILSMCLVEDIVQNFMVTQREVQSTEEGGRGVEEHVWGREWVGWFDLVVGEAPCTRGFLLLVGGAPRQQRGRREVAIHTARWPAELRQQNQQSVSRGQLQEVHSKNLGSSKSQRKPVMGYSPEKIFLSGFLEKRSYVRCWVKQHF